MPGKRFWIIGGASALALALMVSAGVSLTSRTEFCLSCHEMRVHQRELAMSAHARDSDGKEIGCSQCHIPNANVARMLGAKAWLGVRDAWAHFADAGGELDRAAMQKVARRFTDDPNCRKCHEDLKRNARNDGPNSPEGLLAHANYLGENGQSRSGCVGCHVNIAHLPPFDARIPSNQKFSARLAEAKL